MSVDMVQRVSSDQGWPLQRLKRSEALVAKADAIQVLAQTMKEGDAELHGRVRSYVLQFLDSVQRVLSMTMDQDTKPRTKADILQSISFSFSNLAKGAESFGMTCLPGALKRAGLDAGAIGANRQWDQRVISQINVIVGDAKAKVEQDGKAIDVTAQPTLPETPSTESGAAELARTPAVAPAAQ